MKIWITRKAASAIYSRGLQSVQVWLRKPYFQLLKYGDSFDNNDAEKYGYGLYGMWQAEYNVGYGPFQNYIPFSELFGYIDRDDQNCNKIAELVWLKLKEHFHNEDFDNWEKLEADGKSKLEDFCFTLDIDIIEKDPKENFYMIDIFYWLSKKDYLTDDYRKLYEEYQKTLLTDLKK